MVLSQFGLQTGLVLRFICGPRSLLASRSNDLR
ncbi:hypothetical protein BOS5A_201030 [Bosea sp. EC-HK365B]|nr:hypothetical protein BOSE21B_110982 [Bosea sp. 21B]CAD5275334.1 hypothetical protein BOSE7B_40233 [Bosea sp. 7B]VVT59163.1 hypothetical protein BOS5A_201030 [Bosea sp. EC-HK365B]VXC75351.1 hypothetical protein BOSE127_40409 [Bosea sp. 127]